MEGNNFNNIQNEQQLNRSKEQINNEKKGRGLFYFVIAIAVVIIAVVGATYAYFSATTQTLDNSITAGSSSVSLNLVDAHQVITGDLIPVEDKIATYAFAEQPNERATYQCKTYKTDPETQEATEECEEYYQDQEHKLTNATCTDDSGSYVCNTFDVTIGNDNVSPQTLTMYLGTNSNTFTNLYFAVYTEVNGKRVRVSKIAEVSKDVLGEVLIEPNSVEIGTVENAEAINNSYNDLLHATLLQGQQKTFTVVLWIHEAGYDQTGSPEGGAGDNGDANDTFYGYVKITSGNDDSGVTGRIEIIGDKGQNYDDTYDPSKITTQTTQTTETTETTQTTETTETTPTTETTETTGTE